MDNKRDIEQNCGLELARPYVNRQSYGETFNPSVALKKEHYFLNQIQLNQIIIIPGYMKIL